MEIRPATPDDLAGLLEHLKATFGEDDRARVTDLLSTPEAAAAWLLAVDDGQIVCCAARIPHRFHLDGVDFDAVQIEWVATAESHRRRGLVRALFDEHHRIAGDGTDLFLVAGIPYFYRRFGYGYGVEPPRVVAIPAARTVRTGRDGSPEGSGSVSSGGGGAGTQGVGAGHGVGAGGDEGLVRTATLGDLEALVAMGDADAPVRIRRDVERWHRRLRTSHPGAEETLVVVSADGVGGQDLLGWARLQTYPQDGEQYLIFGKAADRATALALVDHAAGLVPPGLRLYAFGGPGRWEEAALTRGLATEPGNGIYVRFPDPVHTLERLVPALDRRLASASRNDTGPLTISLYDRSIHLELDEGRVVEVGWAPAIEDPFDREDVGVAPDHLPALLLGRWGAVGLAERYDDVTLGRHADLMAILFPHLEADIADDL